jgi:hypothetical protein
MLAPPKTPSGSTAAFITKAKAYEGENCLLWPYGRQNGSEGYSAAWFNGKHGHAHRFVCELAHGPAPSSLHHVAHWCGNKACVAPKHLRWVLKAENEADKVRHGTSNRGERQGQAKLTEDAIRAIRAQPERPGVELAKEYGVTQTHISRIRRRTTWGHV